MAYIFQEFPDLQNNYNTYNINNIKNNYFSEIEKNIERNLTPEERKYLNTFTKEEKPINRFMLYLKKVAEDMLVQSNSFKINLNENNTIGFEESNLQQLLNQRDSFKTDVITILNENRQQQVADISTYNFNVMCYEKSLFYHLRYIYYILFNTYELTEVAIRKLLGKNINFILYCDNDTYNRYINHIQLINENSTGQLNNTEEAIWATSNFFTEVLWHVSDTKLNCSYIIQKLREVGVNIYLICSRHKLIKGIGGKRALMNHVNFNIANNMENDVDKNNYMCMYLDDNISSVLNMGKIKNPELLDATIRELHDLYGYGRKSPKATPYTRPDRASASASPRQTCTKRSHVNKILTNYTRDTDYNLITQNCDSISIFDIYTEGSMILLNEENKLMYSINKGSGSGERDNDSDKKDIIDSSIAYKLSIQKAYQIYNKNIVYNPFFSRGLEDMLFNAMINSERGRRNMSYYIRFAHELDIATDKPQDAEDTFPPNTIRNSNINDVPITGINQVYLLCYYHLYLLYNIGELFIDQKNGKITVFDTAFINIYGESKYTKYQIILFKFIFLLENHKELDSFNNLLLANNRNINFYEKYKFLKLLHIFRGVINPKATSGPYKYDIKYNELNIKVNTLRYITDILDKFKHEKIIDFRSSALQDINSTFEKFNTALISGENLNNYNQTIINTVYFAHKNNENLLKKLKQEYYNYENLNILEVIDNKYLRVNLNKTLLNQELIIHIENQQQTVTNLGELYKEIETETYKYKYIRIPSPTNPQIQVNILNPEWFCSMMKRYNFVNFANTYLLQPGQIYDRRNIDLDNYKILMKELLLLIQDIRIDYDLCISKIPNLQNSRLTNVIEIINAIYIKIRQGQVAITQVVTPQENCYILIVLYYMNYITSIVNIADAENIITTQILPNIIAIPYPQNIDEFNKYINTNFNNLNIFGINGSAARAILRKGIKKLEDIYGYDDYFNPDIIRPVAGGVAEENTAMQKKYLKYKQKYLELKKELKLIN
jgi:hypothetical protein